MENTLQEGADGVCVEAEYLFSRTNRIEEEANILELQQYR